MRLHRILALTALAASLTAFTAACGDDDTDDAGTVGSTDETGTGSTSTGGSDPTGGTEETTPDGGALDAELVAFVGGAGWGTDVPAALLTTPEQVAAWIGWFETADPDQADALRSSLPGALDDSTVLVGFSPYGCAEETASLVVAGNDLDVELAGGEEIDCAEAVRFAVVFAVDGAALPTSPTLAGQPVPEQVGPGELVAFLHVGNTVTPSSDAVVLDEATVDGWVAELVDAGLDVGDVGDEVDAAVSAAGTDEVVVGAALSGCAEESAELVIGSGADLAIELIGPEDIDCDAPDTYVALFVVPAELVGR